MPINRENANGNISLFTVDNGATSWWDLRLHVTLTAGPGAQVTLKVNGQDIPDQRGAVQANVDGSSPVRSTSVEVRLAHGDIVTAEVVGGLVDLTFSGEVLSEQL